MNAALESPDTGEKIAACIIDIDATITRPRGQPQIGPDYVLNNAIFEIIAQLMQEHGWSPEAAERAMSDYAEAKLFWDYPEFLAEFDLPMEEGWKRIVRWHEENIAVHDDAVRMIRRLHAARLPLFIASNNPLSGCLLKLGRAGLAGREGSEYFHGIMGTNVCMGVKCSTGFWERCLEQVGHEPERLAVIGDDPHDDCRMPRSLGVETIFLVDRKQEARVKRTPEALWVNTLDCVPEFLASPG